MKMLSRLLCTLLVLALPAMAQAQSPGQGITVFAAASLKESMDEAAAAYQQATGVAVTTSYAASSTLARQIEQGAPAEVFFSADLEWMDYLQARQRVRAGDRHNLLGNTLVLVAPATAATARIDPAAPGAIARALGADGRLAVGQTASVPAGKYARAALEKLGQWNALSPRLAEAESVRAALMLVSRGETPLGIVYGSDAQAEPKVKVVGTFPASSHPPIVYPVAPLAQASPQAQAFVQWLQGPAARDIFRRHGFSLAP
ncbi:molybdate ABC transporter substrate-binding protein [Stenotrophomonas sp. HITSZ_GD]|uniref:molybdate ABC transporter substrate-binding protein n=1 Tax=Stenotrophomonas sp. HITSZ_GD TaxID=3037248 RepID=UPI00240D31F6|nr:molybdate ABC transporter substrate-binding protein [Stenotrophomonas sp. HITSZ_GD]MDG2527059.1 molybdate ABC transporter substrate-binding protein [Stenotrophomonas sp. HITSZ_GD]